MSYLLSICDKSYMVQVILIIKTFFKIACILVPIIIVIASVSSFSKAITTGEESDLKESGKLLVRRLIAGLIIFFLPALISGFINNIDAAKEVDFLACYNSASKEKVESLQAKEEAEAKAAKQLEEAEAKTILHEAYVKEQQEKGARKVSFEQWKKEKEEEERKRLQQSGYTPTGTISEPVGANLTGNAWVESLLSGAREVTDFIRAHNFTYGYSTVNPALDQSQGIVACDNCVGWFLYKAGYTDGQPSFYGLDLASSQTFMQERGFTKITDQSKLQPGDIVYVNPDASGFPGHVFLLGNYIGDGIWERYDCGSVNRIRLTGSYSSYQSQPFHEPVNNFAFAYRSPKAQ